MHIGRQGLKTFYIMELLLQRTDEEHTLNATQISAILEAEYGVRLSRPTIYGEIDKLEEAGMDIVRQEGKTGGYYVASRQFELPELKLLVDAVQSSRFITRKKTEGLIRKLETLCSREQARQLESQVVIYNRPKTENETIYYNVDMLHSAIFRDRQITFQYVDWTVKKKMEFRHDGAWYVVSPQRLVWDDENYYLIAYDENAGKTKHYRVDKMRNMGLLDTPRSSSAREEDVNLAAFSKKTFGMFGGTDAGVRLRCRNHLAGVVLDRFGSDIWMVPEDDEHFTATVMVTVSRQFFGWVTAIGSDMQITGPEEVRDDYRRYLEEVLREYRSE